MEILSGVRNITNALNYGMCEDDGGLFKLFTLTVKYGEDPGKADDLAKRAAQLVSETTLGQL
ncbi:hypothetical protein [Proteiniphilum sp.]|uniref:hypothetical protein n=1 Tax=Proteiniphilum sp. TaxID=1926877 RepID=UPI002B218334|nr:hypothetical protein [Proteiniphilum sp.]